MTFSGRSTYYVTTPFLNNLVLEARLFPFDTCTVLYLHTHCVLRKREFRILSTYIVRLKIQG